MGFASLSLIIIILVAIIYFILKNNKNNKKCIKDTDCGKSQFCCNNICKKEKCIKSYLGQSCKKSSDCLNYDDPKILTVGCTKFGDNLKKNQSGICTTPCINQGLGYCPNQIRV